LYVVDTNALIWYLKRDKKLGTEATVVFAAAERGETRLIVSAIVVAEIPPVSGFQPDLRRFESQALFPRSPFSPGRRARL
jgi:hypothetical protein